MAQSSGTRWRPSRGGLPWFCRRPKVPDWRIRPIPSIGQFYITARRITVGLTRSRCASSISVSFPRVFCSGNGRVVSYAFFIFRLRRYKEQERQVVSISSKGGSNWIWQDQESKIDFIFLYYGGMISNLRWDFPTNFIPQMDRSENILINCRYRYFF